MRPIEREQRKRLIGSLTMAFTRDSTSDAEFRNIGIWKLWHALFESGKVVVSSTQPDSNAHVAVPDTNAIWRPDTRLGILAKTSRQNNVFTKPSFVQLQQANVNSLVRAFQLPRTDEQIMRDSPDRPGRTAWAERKMAKQ
jgi:hypothetical protein